jgi:hypothetical protein
MGLPLLKGQMVLRGSMARWRLAGYMDNRILLVFMGNNLNSTQVS